MQEKKGYFYMKNTSDSNWWNDRLKIHGAGTFTADFGGGSVGLCSGGKRILYD